MKERVSSSSIKISSFSFHFIKILHGLVVLFYTSKETLELVFAFTLKLLSMFIVIVSIIYNADAKFLYISFISIAST